RRRHTISKRDWSSDVCSSDLGNVKLSHVSSGFARIFPYDWYAIELNEAENWSGQFCTDLTLEQSLTAHLDMLENFNADIPEFTRSEARRVGKDGERRWTGGDP